MFYRRFLIMLIKNVIQLAFNFKNWCCMTLANQSILRSSLTFLISLGALENKSDRWKMHWTSSTYCCPCFFSRFLTQFAEVSAVRRLQKSVPEVWQLRIQRPSEGSLHPSGSQRLTPECDLLRLIKDSTARTHTPNYSNISHRSTLTEEHDLLSFTAVHIKSGTKHPIYLCVLNYRLSEYTSKLSRGNSLLHQPLDRADCMCERRLNHCAFLNLRCKMDCLWKEVNVSVICSQSQTAIKWTVILNHYCLYITLSLISRPHLFFFPYNLLQRLTSNYVFFLKELTELLQWLWFLTFFSFFLIMRLFPLHVITYSLTLNAARLYHHCYYSVSALLISSTAHRGGSSSQYSLTHHQLAS